ncbi:serpin family A member 6 [Phyllostomus discolor]|uniref:Corticosteroid-binding globulin n=1 Tax=Phyllostomus discolor TaxID=89673 RepID=A0A6J2L3S8_9CHIR|nr:corticosteroid-binding globulin [Phyllostomus discolor]KAF6132828.1 serpin family A member 6 [Phyllostomus discolor]
MLLSLCACLLWLSAGGLRTVQAEDPNADTGTGSQHRNLAPNNVDFAFDLYKHLVASAPGENIFISPVSISMSLAMLSLGARGPTRAQLLRGLGFNLTEMPEAQIHHNFQYLHHLLKELDATLGNALFLNQSLDLLESFSADAKLYYELDTLAIDQDWATASKQINEYIKNKTQEKTVNLFSALDSPAVLILVNYIFFKGTWAHPFHLESTREENFYVNESTLVKVPMMFQSSEIKYLNDSVLRCQLVQLDYRGNETVFFVLPEKGQIDAVINALSRDTIQRWSDALTSGQVDLYIPKVSITGAYDLEALLKVMGFEDVFSNQANFSGITRETQLKLSKVVHKAGLQLDEKGVKATAPPVVTRNMTSEPRTILFNQPFIVMVFDNYTWSSLFLVKVVNPKSHSPV